MTESQKKTFARRLEDLAPVFPDLNNLYLEILKFGGDAVVPMPEPSSTALYESGMLMNAKIQLKIMEDSACHLNVAKLWHKHYKDMVSIGRGYGLSGDGLWRQHSWGMLRDGGILETTEIRDKYFGMVFWGPFAEGFAKDQFKKSGLKY